MTTIMQFNIVCLAGITSLNIFEITLANYSGVFYAGSMVEGHVTVELKAPMPMKGKYND